MTHIPYGYQIVDAKATLDEEKAKTVRALFEEYLERRSAMAAARAVGLNKTHGMVARMLTNKTYLGTDFYPRLIDDETFQKAQSLKAEIARRLGRIHHYETKESTLPSFRFEIGNVEKKYQDPYEQARYAYEQIKETDDER